ncbi:MAG: tetratricopeptide repeat protein [Deltaproteobacteria bacterium]|jgi:tetratricopeptide (TPR) repeat protein|nr:tetratricopeptide repeat protein [Deltaproteobacteria bacterium]
MSHTAPPPPPLPLRDHEVWAELQRALSALDTAGGPAAVRWIGAQLAAVERNFGQQLDADPVGVARVGLSLAEALSVLGAEDALRRVVLGLDRYRSRLPPPLADEVLLLVARDGVRRREGYEWAHEAAAVLERAERRRDARLVGLAVRLLAQAAWQEGKGEVAVAHARRACELPEGAAAAQLLGNYLWGLGRQAEAEAAYVHALQQPSTRANPMRAATLAANLASLLSEQGRHDEAIKGFRFALRVQSEAGAKRHELILRANFGMALIDANELDEAADQLQQAWELAQHTLSGRPSAAPREGVVCLRLLRGEPEAALAVLQQGPLLDDADPWYDGQLVIWEAFARAALGRLSEAEALARAGAQRARAVNDLEAGPLLSDLALLHIAQLRGQPLDQARLDRARAAAGRWQCLRIGLRLLGPVGA